MDISIFGIPLMVAVIGATTFSRAETKPEKRFLGIFFGCMMLFFAIGITRIWVKDGIRDLNRKCSEQAYIASIESQNQKIREVNSKLGGGQLMNYQFRYYRRLAETYPHNKTITWRNVVFNIEPVERH